MKSLPQSLFAKPAMNFFSRIGIAAVLMLLVTAPAAFAQIYTFTFTGNTGIDATGTLHMVGGVAQSDSSITVINVPLETNSMITTTASGNFLTTGGNVRDLNGDVITYDTVVNPLSNPIFDNTGVVFASGYAGLQSSTPAYDTLINIWGNSPSSYGMFIGEANPADLNPDGTLIAGRNPQWVYVYNETGTLTLTQVPEPTTFALILGALALGFVVIRRHATA